MDKALEDAQRTVREWHKIALKMRDLAISGDCEAIQKVYFDAAMALPFYGADPDPFPAKRAPHVDPMGPTVALLVKLGSIIVHFDEGTTPEEAHPFDIQTARQLLADPEVVEWIKQMNAAALLPVKRKKQ